MFLLAIEESRKKREEENLPYRRQHSRYQKCFYRALSAEERRLRQRRIPRESLHDVEDSAWRRLYYSYNNQALITATGLDHGTFDYLLSKFQPIFDSTTPFGNNDDFIKTSTRGRRRKVTAIDCLGLVLFWTRTRGSVFPLQMDFGLTMTNLSKYLRFGRRIVIEVLKNDEYARIAVPSPEKINEYKGAIAAKYPSLENVWSAMDGVKTPLQQAGSTKQQSYFYNGWKHGHFITSVFCFCPDGTIPIAFMNVPGATHDSTVAEWGGIYNKLERVYNETGGICTVDSAFRMRNAPYILKSSQNTLIGNGETLEEIQQDIEQKREATSMRQAAEWGMRGLQSSFPRLCDRMVFETRGERRISIKMMILVYNLRARMVGINQIKNFYMPALNNEATLH